MGVVPTMRIYGVVSIDLALGVEPVRITYYLGRETLIRGRGRREERDVHFGIPPGVVELGMQVELRASRRRICTKAAFATPSCGPRYASASGG